MILVVHKSAFENFGARQVWVQSRAPSRMICVSGLLCLGEISCSRIPHSACFARSHHVPVGIGVSDPYIRAL